MTALAKRDWNAESDSGVATEWLEFSDDVTPEGVAYIRELVKEDIDAEEWETIDGFRCVAFS